ncbi:DinB family protein [Peribacillus castrilensis]|uniref:DinB superfamily protein n=1 Tax=Peribacillus simplex TaxID=1478 RepID=A0AAN2PKU4_9BACI|nr:MULTISPECIES: DinB family protein [Peribacillus]MBD8587707.1 DinB family protein [Peribacillus simplex]MCP1154696.1 DinB family protein [Peribacillus frigoritolerans]MCT1391125.1 DinB family protein [Peribacillus frigoritolerans]MEA3575643.1 DinB family protein [Peribacillus frigoritolerans]NCT36919.1 DinB family protein [Peribacillus frigoritolerans]
MKKVINGINHWIDFIPEEFNRMTEKELNHRPMPHKWSKKEILGHLCDSALNNMNRFIKIQYEVQPYVIQSYNQDQWVLVQNYQERPLDEIVNLFCTLNKQIIHIITNTPNDRFSNLCDIGNNQIKTMEWLIKDYLDHMEHHINNQILIKKE